MLLNYIKSSPHRVLLEKKLKSISTEVNGEVLDIGSKNRRYDHLFRANIIAADINENKKKNVIKADINDLQFKNNCFDAILCLEVIEYLKNPKVAIDQLYRVLKPGGKLVLSTPFMYKYHNDLARYSKECLLDLLSKFKDIKIEEIGNFYTVILDIIRDKIIFVKFAPIRYFLYLPYIVLTAIIPLVKSNDFKHNSGYFIIAKK